MTPEELKKLNDDKSKTEAQKKVEGIAEEKTRVLTEDGTDLTAPINLNRDPSILKWEDTWKYTTWNLFIKYLAERRKSKKDLKDNPTPDNEFSATLNTGEKASKTQEFLDDFNNNYVYNKHIIVVEHIKKKNIATSPILRESKKVNLDTFIWSSKIYKLTINDVKAAQKYQAVTNPQGSTSIDGRKNEVKIDGIIGTQTIQMYYPTRKIIYEAALDNDLIEFTQAALGHSIKLNGAPYGPFRKSDFPNDSIPNYIKLNSKGTFESLIPLENNPNLFHKAVWGNKRYMIPTNYMYDVLKNNENENPEETKWKFGTAISSVLSDKSKWIPYNPSYNNKLTKYVDDNTWGTPIGPNWDTIQPTLPFQSNNNDVAKNQKEGNKREAETKLTNNIIKNITK
jgi:hypothetical protein